MKSTEPQPLGEYEFATLIDRILALPTPQLEIIADAIDDETDRRYIKGIGTNHVIRIISETDQ